MVVALYLTQSGNHATYQNESNFSVSEYFYVFPTDHHPSVTITWTTLVCLFYLLTVWAVELTTQCGQYFHWHGFQLL